MCISAGGLRGASIIDSLDTLYIMGLMEEYNDAKEWVQTSLDLNSVRNFCVILNLDGVSVILSFISDAITTVKCQVDPLAAATSA